MSRASPVPPAPRPAPPAPRPRLSVVLPTRGRPAPLSRCLQALLCQTLPHARFEVLVVDGEPSELIRGMVATLAAQEPTLRLRYLRPAAGGGAATALNCGWRAAQAALVAFTHDDALPDPAWLEHGLRAMRAGTQPALAGHLCVGAVAQGRTDQAAPCRVRAAAPPARLTANAFVRSRALRQLGGFDAHLRSPAAVALDLALRLQALPGGVGRCAPALVRLPLGDGLGAALREARLAVDAPRLRHKHGQRCAGLLPARSRGDALLAAGVLGMLAALAAGQWMSAGLAGALALAAAVHGAARRLRLQPARGARPLAQALALAALLPFAVLWWRLRGAWQTARSPP